MTTSVYGGEGMDDLQLIMTTSVYGGEGMDGL